MNQADLRVTFGPTSFGIDWPPELEEVSGVSDVRMAAVVPLSGESVRELAAVRGDPVVVSFYLDVDGRRRPRWADVEEAAGRLAGRARQRAARLDVERAVERDLERILTRVEEGMDRSVVRGLALFSCAEQGFLHEIRVPRSVRDQVAIDRSPVVRQLEEALEVEVPFLVAVVDRQQCRILRVCSGVATEVAGPYDEMARAVDVDRELGGFDRYEEDALRRHLRRCAQALFDQAKHSRGAHVLIGGTEAATAELERYLDPSVRRRLAGRMSLVMTVTPAEAAAAVIDVEQTLEERAKKELVERLRQASALPHGRCQRAARLSDSWKEP